MPCPPSSPGPGQRRPPRRSTGACGRPSGGASPLGLVLTITLVAFESLAISTVLPGGVRRPRRPRPLRLGVQRLLPRQPARHRHRRAPGRPAGDRAAVRRSAWRCSPSGSWSAGWRRRWACWWRRASRRASGPGAIPAVAYTSVGRAYPRPLRPRVFAVFSTAWVVPGLIGPAASSGIAHAIGWRARVPRAAPVRRAGGGHHPARRSPARSGRVDDAGARRTDRRGPHGTGARAHRRRGGGARGARRRAARRRGGAGRSSARRWPSRAFVAPRAARARCGWRPGIPAAVAVQGHPHLRVLRRRRLRVAHPPGRPRPGHLGGRRARSPLTTIAWTAAAWVQERWIHRVGPRRVVRDRAAASWRSGSRCCSARSGRCPCAVGHRWCGASAGFGIGLAYSPISVVVLGLAEPGQRGDARRQPPAVRRARHRARHRRGRRRRGPRRDARAGPSRSAPASSAFAVTLVVALARRRRRPPPPDDAARPKRSGRRRGPSSRWAAAPASAVVVGRSPSGASVVDGLVDVAAGHVDRLARRRPTPRTRSRAAASSAPVDGAAEQGAQALGVRPPAASARSTGRL